MLADDPKCWQATQVLAFAFLPFLGNGPAIVWAERPRLWVTEKVDPECPITVSPIYHQFSQLLLKNSFVSFQRN